MTTTSEREPVNVSQASSCPVMGGQERGSGRITELDYLKGIMILLMISFHLVYIGDSYPYAKRVVYTFHMPIFLLISGYLQNSGKPARQFLRTMLWYAVPYVIMESGYTIMASLLPIREHIDHLTLTVFLEKLFVHPLGPYWYLHTLILCATTFYAVHRLMPRFSVSQFILTGILYSLYARVGILSLPASFYFLAGVIIRHHLSPLLHHPSATVPNVSSSGSDPHPTLISFPKRRLICALLSLLALLLLISHPSSLDSYSVGSVLIVCLVITMCLAFKPYLGEMINRTLILLGRNTLCLFLFSPIFTILCKQLVPLLSFDPTGMIFLVLSLTICTVGSLCISRLIDICRLSPYIFGKERITITK